MGLLPTLQLGSVLYALPAVLQIALGITAARTPVLATVILLVSPYRLK